MNIHRLRFTCRSIALTILLLLAAGGRVALAEGTPTPERPFHLYLPILFKEPPPPTATPSPTVTPTVPEQSITFQQGANGYAGTLTTYITSYSDPYLPHNNEPFMNMRWLRGTSSRDVEAGLVRFDLTAIPRHAAIREATLWVYATRQSNLNSIRLAAYRVLRPWLPDQTNWYSATVNIPWSLMGCNGIGSDRLGVAAATAEAPSAGVWISFAIGPLLQEWVSDPAANYGLILKPIGASDTPSVGYEFASAAHPEVGFRPALAVTYILLPTATPTRPTSPTGTPTATASPTPQPPTSTPTGTATPTATWAPSSSWWDTDYSYRRRLTVQTAAEFSVDAGYAVSLTLNSDDLIIAGKLRADRNDWRIVAWNGWAWAEIDRNVAGPAETWFALVRPIAAAGRDEQYYVYYGNPDEETPPRADKDHIYTFYDDFDTYDAGKWPASLPSGVIVAGGVVTVTAFSADGGPADSCPGAFDCMLSRAAFGLGYQVEYRARHPDYVYGKKHDADQGFSDDGHTNEAKLRSYGTGLFQRVNRDGDGTSGTVVQCCQPADTQWHIFKVTRVNANRVVYQIDNSVPDPCGMHVPQGALPVHIRAYSDEPFEQSRNVVDWVKVRPVVAEEPVVTWGREETAIFGAPLR